MDQTNLILGTFKFKIHGTNPSSPQKPASYTLADFGELLNGILKPGASLKEAWDSSSGVVGLLKLVNTKRTLDIEADLQKIDPTIVLPYYMGSASGAAPAPGKITDVFGWLGIQGEGEPIVPNPNSNEGAGILTWYSFPCGIWVDGDLKANGEDFSTLKLHVRAYLARGAGIWTAAARPVTAIP